MSEFTLSIEIHGLTKIGSANKREKIIKSFERTPFSSYIDITAFTEPAVDIQKEPRLFFRLYSSCTEVTDAVVISKLQKLGMPVQIVKLTSSHPELK